VPTVADDPLQLDQGTIALWFQADSLGGTKGLLSKDAGGYGDGGHLMLYLDGGQVALRMQDTGTTYTLHSGAGTVQAGAATHVAFSFGDGGARLYLDGVLVGSDPYTGGLAGNLEPLLLGALGWKSNPGAGDNLEGFFAGVIDEVAIFGAQLDAASIAQLYDAGLGALIDDGTTLAA
jgi:hypothetical protein